MCENGSETFATTASLALTHWFVRHLPDRLPELPEIGVLYTGPSGPPCYSPAFLPGIAAACERKWNLTPPVVVGAFSDDDLPKTGLWAKEVERRRDAGDPLVIAYEETCLRILEWLREHGDIVALHVGQKFDLDNGEEYADDCDDEDGQTEE
jgi:hypothetical protein